MTMAVDERCEQDCQPVNRIAAQALQSLIDGHGAALVLYARQWCREPDDAVQEALIELARQEPAPSHPVAWLYTVVRRRAMNLARAAERRTRHHERACEAKQRWFVPTDKDSDDGADLQSLLARLPQLEREIVVARIWGERSFVEIATLVEQPVSTVHRRYQQALAELECMIESNKRKAIP